MSEGIWKSVTCMLCSPSCVVGFVCRKKISCLAIHRQTAQKSEWVWERERWRDLAFIWEKVNEKAWNGEGEAKKI